jgi:hypothetical protein
MEGYDLRGHFVVGLYTDQYSPRYYEVCLERGKEVKTGLL